MLSKMEYIIDDSKIASTMIEEEKKKFPWGALVAILPAIATMISKK